MEDPQADGYTPRLSASMLKTGNYNGKIVSIVGKFVSDLSFRCCDGELVDLSTEHAAIENLDREVAVEVVGQVSSPNLIAVSTKARFHIRRNSRFLNPQTLGVCCS